MPVPEEDEAGPHPESQAKKKKRKSASCFAAFLGSPPCTSMPGSDSTIAREGTIANGRPLAGASTAQGLAWKRVLTVRVFLSLSFSPRPRATLP